MNDLINKKRLFDEASMRIKKMVKKLKLNKKLTEIK